jgi:hypothetical protein
LHSLGDDAAIARTIGTCVLNTVLEIEQRARLVVSGGVVDQDRATLESVSVNCSSA